MNLSDLAPHPKNPRKISDDQLKRLTRSLEKFGDLSGIVFNLKTKRVVGGHQRIKALPSRAKITIETTHKKPTSTGTVATGFIEIKGERFSYRQVSWDEDTEKAANIAANKHGGEWDVPQLTEWLSELNLSGFEMDLTGFGSDELEKILKIEKVGLCDPDEIPEHVEPKTKRGDIYQLGRHRLMCGDSTSITDMDRLFSGVKADLFVTDPPYGVSYVEKNAAVNGGVVKNAVGKKIENDSLSPEAMHQLWSDIFAMSGYFTDQASYYIFSPQGGELMMMMMQAIHQSEWMLKHTLIWAKQNFVFGRSDYHYQHEPILYGWKKKGTHHWNGDRKQGSVLQFDKAPRNDLHPTTKPVALIEYIVQNSSKRGDTVFDAFSGSSTTMIACEKLDRVSLAMELDPQYVDVSVARWEKFTGHAAVQQR